MKYVLYIDSKQEEITRVREKIKLLLELWKIRENDIEQADHALNQLLTKLIEVSTEDHLKVEVHKLFGDCVIRISGRGTPLKDEDIPTGSIMPELSEVDSEQESILRAKFHFITKRASTSRLFWWRRANNAPFAGRSSP